MRRKIEVEEWTCDVCHATWGIGCKPWSSVTINGEDYEVCNSCSVAIEQLQHFMILALDLQVSIKPLELGA